MALERGLIKDLESAEDEKTEAKLFNKQKFEAARQMIDKYLTSPSKEHLLSFFKDQLNTKKKKKKKKSKKKQQDNENGGEENDKHALKLSEIEEMYPKIHEALESWKE